MNRPQPILLLLLLLLGLGLLAQVVPLYTDWLWFVEVGYSEVFVKTLSLRGSLFAALAIGVLVFLYANLTFAARTAAPDVIWELEDQLGLPSRVIIEPLIRRFLPIVLLLIALASGMRATVHWETVLGYLNATPFGTVDPLFGYDLSFFVFVLPLWRLVHGWALTLVSATIVLTLAVYVLQRSLVLTSRGPRLAAGARSHLLVLGAVALGLKAVGFWLDRFGLGVYPALLQRFRVTPNELAAERPFIGHNIRMTRQAYGLDRIVEREFPADEALDARALERNAATVKNIRLWDYRPLLRTFAQLQEIRTYYKFVDVDNDRYVVNGEYRQLMLSPRELSYQHLQSRIWINEHLTFTHGYGAVVGPVNQRVRQVAPFFRFDRDPDMVVDDDGRLIWMLDGYTPTDRYPYSEPVPGMGNYIRNSVKVTIDAYDGSVTFYRADDTDPIVRAYGGAFPGLLKPLDKMPETLRRHIRYPEDFFAIQARTSATYHMLDPQVFYNKEDLWAVPRRTIEGRDRDMEPYFTIMRLPGEQKEEFMLLTLFNPARRDNMIAWMAGRSDPPNYGRLIVYNFPKQKLVYGPRQIDARIDQDPIISQQLSLWNQRGSSVIRGSLLAIPIDQSLIYVQPLYLAAAEQGALPELRRVIVAYGNQIAMEPTLEQSLSRLFGGRPAIAVTATSAPSGAPADSS